MKIYTPQEVADFLHVDVRTIWRYVKENKLKATRISPRIIRFKEEDVAFLLGGTK